MLNKTLLLGMLSLSTSIYANDSLNELNNLLTCRAWQNTEQPVLRLFDHSMDVTVRDQKMRQQLKKDFKDISPNVDDDAEGSLIYEFKAISATQRIKGFNFSDFHGYGHYLNVQMTGDIHAHQQQLETAQYRFKKLPQSQLKKLPHPFSPMATVKGKEVYADYMYLMSKNIEGVMYYVALYPSVTQPTQYIAQCGVTLS
ncbi:hypothetical protein GFH30_06935 [Acinetobacter wanghuae]|uniref:Uncharacterized protein n=1 Tax=Acinetobacter wanghuae TaxID=2662362 RepID=A0A5Q0P4X1_9GAMM|nr:hypothetical protein [Acinetobacter wanghuae]MQW92516.1 hypothetical protein [Acinetobacter wanghuae]QGA11141.1 hypothetical protein GFH30_06935 [Acinetobacter wanghuae]